MLRKQQEPEFLLFFDLDEKIVAILVLLTNKGLYAPQAPKASSSLRYNSLNVSLSSKETFNPKLCAILDFITGPNCFGSPTRTICIHNEKNPYCIKTVI